MMYSWIMRLSPNFIRSLWFAVLCLALCVPGARANHAFQSPARSFFLTDYQSGQVIASKDQDELMPPSSMIKLMTAELTFGALRSGKLSLGAKITVPKAADFKSLPPDASKICLSEGQTITVEDALTGLIVVSGADAAITLATAIAGGEPQFIDLMAKRAQEIGMDFTSFGNASGLPDVSNLSTSRELAMLATHIARTYPEYMRFFKVRRFEFVNPVAPQCRDWIKTHTINYNRLLFIMGGAEGMKTGHTFRGGYGIVAAAERKGRRLIGVINGLAAKNHDALAQEGKRLLEYGYDNTYNKEIKAEVAIPVWYGQKRAVKANTERPFTVTLDNGADMTGLKVVAMAPNRINAPIKKGDLVGLVVARLDGRDIKTENLYAAEDVPRVRFFARIIANIQYFLTGK